jgi:hypothetical protein
VNSVLPRLVEAIVALGGLGGLALLVRAMTGRGTAISESAEKVTVLQEREIERQHNRSERLEAERDEAEEALAVCQRRLVHARMLVRYYRSRHGDPTDPHMARIVANDEG